METATFHKLRFSHLFSRWLVLFTLAHFGHHLLTALPTPLLPFIRHEFELDYTSAGLVFSVFSITYGLSQLPGGWLADRLGARTLMSAGIIGVAASGVAIYFTHSYLLLLVCLGIMGMIGGGYHPAAPPLVCATVAPGARGRALGVHAVGGSAAFFVAPLVVAVTAAVWGWRESYLVLAIPTLLFGILLYAAVGRFRCACAPSRVTEGEGHFENNASRSRFLSFVALSATGAIVINVAVSFLPLLLVDRFLVTEEKAAALLAIIYLVGIFANIGVGFLTDRISRRGILIVVVLVLAAALAAFNLAPYPLAVFLLLAVLGVTVVVLQNVAESFIMAGVPAERCSSVLGTFYFTTIAGSGLFTPLVGALIDWRGFTSSYIILAVFLVVAVLVYILRRARQAG